MGNKTGFRGVSRRHEGRYQAILVTGGVKRYLGTFDSAEDAALAWDEAAADLPGRKQPLNFPVAERAAGEELISSRDRDAALPCVRAERARLAAGPRDLDAAARVSALGRLEYVLTNGGPKRPRDLTELEWALLYRAVLARANALEGRRGAADLATLKQIDSLLARVGPDCCSVSGIFPKKKKFALDRGE